MATSRRERKVVTVLFCDLVGFTSRAESLDPEDVAAFLRPYHERVRSELERHGGTVEKFIGDAVMAIFGAPVAHEDDPERALRAALAIRDVAREEERELRVGIATGEALVTLGARPEEGEGMAAGDVVNTAARLQAAAPVNGILVSDTTYRATRHAIDYREAEPVVAKGKEAPIAVWEALDARARFGTEVLDHVAGALVGRERELAALRGALDRTRETRSSQLVTLVGVPGIGKSRLLYELSRIADAEPDLITWRQGRCLAYGDGVTYWALAEIVKAEAGVLEADSEAVAGEKLHRAVADAIDPPDAEWVEHHLRSLVGLGQESELGGDRRSESFAAWRRFFEELAAQRPLVLVFEDLQWADEGLLDFVDELAEWAGSVPLLVVCTARPELLARRPGWGGGKLNAATLAIEPLSDEETARLMADLLERPVLPAEVQTTLLDRAGGNPLYAEQFAQLYMERGSADELPLPETLQGIIAARLDSLPSGEKTLLQRASVVGKVFWTGSLGMNGQDVEGPLHSLERKGFIRRQRRSSVAGETELAFAHALVRDVAYGQIPRGERAEKHGLVAEWIEALGRPEDHAEMLAHHWRSALELARAAAAVPDELVERTRTALRDAGDRAIALYAFDQAEGYFGEALTLTTGEDPQRPDLLFRRARALHLAQSDEQTSALEEAREALLAAGNHGQAAETEAFLADAAWLQGSQALMFQHLEEARRLLEGEPPSPAKARVLAITARRHVISGRLEGEQVAREALAMAEELGLDELRAHALGTIGIALSRGGDSSAGIALTQQALAIAQAASSPHAAVLANNLASQVMVSGDYRRGAELWEEAWALGSRLGGIQSQEDRFAKGVRVFILVDTGRWDEALELANEFIAETDAGSPHYQRGGVQANRASLRLARGDITGAIEDFTEAEAFAREAGDPQALLPVLAHIAVGYAELGRRKEAQRAAREIVQAAQEHPSQGDVLAFMSMMAAELGIEQEVRAVVDAMPSSRWRDLIVLGLDQRYKEGIALLDEMGLVMPAAVARLRFAETLIASGRRAEGRGELDSALAFFRSVGATFYISRGEALLAASA
jgi:class 3 adenylate cyclase/tetratricopeptide (TPR) repeat protein